MLTQTKKFVRIPISEWKELKNNPSFYEFIDLLEDQKDLQKAKNIKGKDLTINQYLKKRGLQINP